jgi:hypothetical protein
VPSRGHRFRWLVHGAQQGKSLIRDVAINVIGNLIAASIVWLLLSATGYVRSYPLITYWSGIGLAFIIAIGLTVVLNGLLVDRFGDQYLVQSESDPSDYPDLPEHLHSTYATAELLEVLFWFISAGGLVLAIVNALPWIDLPSIVIYTATTVYLLSALASSVGDIILVGKLGRPESDSVTE